MPSRPSPGRVKPITDAEITNSPSLSAVGPLGSSGRHRDRNTEARRSQGIRHVSNAAVAVNGVLSGPRARRCDSDADEGADDPAGH